MVKINFGVQKFFEEVEEEMPYQLDKFQYGLEKMNIMLSEKQLNQFLTFYELLIEKNKVMNLTAITEFQEVVEKHFLDSLSLVRVISEDRQNNITGAVLGFPHDMPNAKMGATWGMKSENKIKVLDLGTGAGFPGIPLKIVFPELEMTLMDSLNKRVLFLQEVISELDLSFVVAVHGRAEEMARKPEYREQFGLCISRAVANLSSLSEYCIPFVKKGGMFISYKSGEVEEEVDMAKNAVQVLGGRICQIDKFVLEGTELSRSFVKIRKISSTPGTYPRKAGTPAKRPIK